MAHFPGRARWLESDNFLAHRGETIIACAAHFGLALAEDAAREIANGPAFSTHSKEIGRAFDPEEPLQPKPEIPVIDEEIAMVSEWVRQVARQASIPMEFPANDGLLGPR